MPNTPSKNGPSHHLDHVVCGTKRIGKKDLVVFGEELFDKRKEGITFETLTRRYQIGKSRAQRILKRGVQGHLFFTPTRTNPQKYYPESRRYAMVEYLNNKGMVLKETTGTTHTTHTSPTSNIRGTNCNTNTNYPLSSCLEYQKANHLLDIMISLSFSPMLVHKLVVEMFLDEDSYDLIGVKPWKGNLGILQKERIDNTEVKCVFYKNGKLVLHVVCSNRPFKLETEEDVAILCSYFGQVRDRIEYQISDPLGRIVPPISKWILKQCEFNKDVTITDEAQITFPDMQLSTTFQTFRLYVKDLEGKAHARCESLVKVNQPLVQFLESNINPVAEILSRIDRLSEDIKEIAKAQNSHLAIYHNIDSSKI